MIDRGDKVCVTFAPGNENFVAGVVLDITDDGITIQDELFNIHAFWRPMWVTKYREKNSD